MSEANNNPYRTLPEPIRLEDTREIHDVEPLRPERSPDEVDRETFLRNAGTGF